MMKFAAATADAAARIRAGSLVGPDDFSQVPQKTHETLALINERGCLTFDSQDGGEQDTRQRSYVSAFMKRGRADDAVEKMNSAGYVAFSPVLLTDWPEGVPRIPVTYDAGRPCTHAPHFIDAENLALIKRGIRLDGREAVTLVEFVDPVWGRAATGKNGLFTWLSGVLREIQPFAPQ